MTTANQDQAPTQTLTRLAWQQELVEFAAQHPHVSLLIDSERMTGKSFACRDVMLQHHMMFGDRARTLVVRPVLSELDEFRSESYRLACMYFGEPNVVLNKHESTLTLAGHGSISFYGVATPDDAIKVLGRSFTQFIFEEFSTVPEQVFRTLRPSLRSAALPGHKSVATRIVCTTNAWGPSAPFIRKMFIRPEGPGVVFREDPDDPTSRLWLRINPSLQDNPFFDRQMLADLKSEPDPVKRLAHLVGGDAGWNAIGSGGLFEGILTYANELAPWPDAPLDPNEWSIRLAYDHGAVQPAHAILIAEKIGGDGPSPNGWLHARGDLVVFAEVSTARPDDLDRAEFPLDIGQLAELIHGMCRTFGFSPVRGIADAAIFAQDGRSPIADEFKRYGIFFRPSSKPPIATRQPFVANLLGRAKQFDHDRIGNPPALYITRDCAVTLATLRGLERHPSNPNLHVGPDHAYDALVYGVMTRRHSLRVTPDFI